MDDGLNRSLGTSIDTTMRRRRSWYRRRMRLRRMLIAVAVGTVLAASCLQSASRYFSSRSPLASKAVPESLWVQRSIRQNVARLSAHSAKSPGGTARTESVYPYSVIPGGLKDLSDLRYAAARDYVVRKHYNHFDFTHARMMRAEARLVYLSYRIRDKIFWTRKQVRLHPGELLVTDGNITARARCGNQVSETAKPEVSDEEPDEDVLDRPVAELEPGPSAPVHPLLAPPDLPAGEPIAPRLSASSFSFPYVPYGVPIPSGVCRGNDEIVDGHCRPKHHKPPVVPEPSTILLVVSGLSLVLWRYRTIARPLPVESR